MLPDPILTRLAGIQAMLAGAHQASAPLSAASSGLERQQFIDLFLSAVLPPQFRFGTGDAVDRQGSLTGQLDVVVEYPHLPSLPMPGQPQGRLYLAEGIAAVIEVKSDASRQQAEIISKANDLRRVRRDFRNQIGYMESRQFMAERYFIPLFVAAYTGWNSLDPLKAMISEAPVQGILIIDPPLFASSPAFDSITSSGPLALWGLITSLHKAVRSLLAAYVDLRAYLQSPEE